MPDVLRIIDANANRAREAMRVMEEAARFVLDRSDLSEACKQLRHDLAAALAGVHGLTENRDTPGDVGTRISTAGEASRASVADVAIAAGKRLSEALRAIEEYGKTLGEAAPAGFASGIEQLRYRGYDLEQRLTLALGAGRAVQWKLCVLLTESLCTRHPWRQVLEQALEGGADCIQVREKEMDAGPLLERVREVMAICTGRAAVIVNDRPDVALAAGADGVHVGQTDLPLRAVRKVVGRQLLVGVSTADIEQARAAVEAGADYCGVGPMFATTTKQKDHIVGPAYLRKFIQRFPGMPHLAIAGIGAGNISELVEAGARGVAVSSAVCSAAQPGEVVRGLVKALSAPRQ